MTAVPRRAVSLIGAPTDVGAADRGASMGPEAMRVAGLKQALEGRGLEVLDRGVDRTCRAARERETDE